MSLVFGVDLWKKGRKEEKKETDLAPVKVNGASHARLSGVISGVIFGSRGRVVGSSVDCSVVRTLFIGRPS